MARYVIGIDQSTQGTKGLVVDERGRLVHRCDEKHRQIVNGQGWVSHDLRQIAANVVAVARRAVTEAGIDPAEVAGVGISNQRETTAAWDASTGEPLCDAVVWQCARARGVCEQVSAREGAAERLRAATGLTLSPYYPAAKMAWILQNVPAARKAAARGDLRLGTMDAWVVWTLTGGAEFRCDFSNASRTQLLDVRAGEWSEEACALFGIERAWLPEVTDSDGAYGFTDLGGFLPEPVPIRGVLGDSHAALFAQGCHAPGMAKATYGTGSSVMMNVGRAHVPSSHGLSSSLAWRMGGVTEHVLEGNVNYAGAVKTWLRDDLGLVSGPDEVTELARRANPRSRVYLVPAFSGLGAPHWRPDTQACVLGMDRTTGRAELARAADESIAYQIADVIGAMEADAGTPLAELRADGGPTRDGYLMGFQADVLQTPVRISSAEEMSGLGAAWACGIALGLYGREVVNVYDAREVVKPRMGAEEQRGRMAGWRRAVRCAIAYSELPAVSETI